MSDPETLAPKLVDAPWDDDQVASLNGYQACGRMHPFTGSVGSGGERATLIATPEGWVEELGGPIVQTWAHNFMLDWSWRRHIIGE